MSTFQDRFRELKDHKHVMYKDIANELCIGVRGVQRYAEGKGFPDFQGLVALARYFGVSIVYLVGESDDPARR
jgi:transcriptional regulator with XRE-family HTH domain